MCPADARGDHKLAGCRSVRVGDHRPLGNRLSIGVLEGDCERGVRQQAVVCQAGLTLVEHDLEEEFLVRAVNASVRIEADFMDSPECGRER